MIRQYLPYHSSFNRSVSLRKTRAGECRITVRGSDSPSLDFSWITLHTISSMTASAHPPCSGSPSILSGSAPVPKAQSASACFSGPFCTHHSSSTSDFLQRLIPVLPSILKPATPGKTPTSLLPSPSPTLPSPLLGRKTRYSDTSGLVVFSQVIHRITSRKTECKSILDVPDPGHPLGGKGPGSAHEAKIMSGQVKSGHSRPSTKDAQTSRRL